MEEIYRNKRISRKIRKKKGNRNVGLETLNTGVKRVSFIFLLVTTLNVIAATGFFILALITEENIWILLLAILFVLFVAFVAMIVMFYAKYSITPYFQDLYNTTRTNYGRLTNFEKELDYYSHDTGVKEFITLNKQIDQINSLINNSALVCNTLDYSKLPLEYPNPNDKRLVSLDSFIKCHKDLILQAELFRNAIFTFFYEDGDEFTDSDIYENLYKNITEEFTEEGVLLAKDEKRTGYIVFLPFIDSMSCFEERLNKVVKNSIYTLHEAGGAKIAVCKAAAVIYPYSDIKDLIPDLRYAIRQSKGVNVYTPERFNEANKSLYHTSLNFNNISKTFEALSKTKVDLDDIPKTKAQFLKHMKALAEYIGFEAVGMGVYNENKHQFDVEFESTKEDQRPLFGDIGYIDYDFIALVDKYIDSDFSYYFSKRSVVNPTLGEKLDIYAIKSGFFYIVKNSNGITNFIYFANRDRESIMVNAYDKESLIVFSAFIAEFSRQIRTETDVHVAERRYRSIMRLTDYNLYSVHRNTYDLVEFSDGLIDAVGEINKGDKCYQKLYGLKEPCKDCPLLAKSKKTSTIGKRTYITSLALERSKEEYPVLLLSPLHKEENSRAYNRYDPQLLIHSTYGLIERLDNLFISKNRGYVLFLKLDNFDDLLERYGEEGLQSRLRYFFKNYRHNHKYGDGEVYVYRDDVFAFVFQEEGRLDILNRSEAIYEISQRKFDEKDEYEIPLKCTYIGLEYPSTYNDRVEFIRNYEKYCKENRGQFNRELFILPDTNYVRMVSREKFIVSLLDNALQSGNISIKYLPEIKGDASKIMGAELLLRLTDKYSNTSLSPYEFIPVASRNNRIGNITNYLIKHIGEIYQKYGLTAFKLAGLRYLSINVDATYFKNEDFLDNIASLMETFHLPKGFIRFEFNEEDIANNVELLRGIAPKIRRLDILLTADSYTGKYISIDEVKELGFTTIKISRNLIKDLEEDPTTISGAKSIVESIQEYEMEYCFVGVENKTQYQLLYELDPNFVAEGYYFYEPLDLDVLLDKLRATLK